MPGRRIVALQHRLKKRFGGQDADEDLYGCEKTGNAEVVSVGKHTEVIFMTDAMRKHSYVNLDGVRYAVKGTNISLQLVKETAPPRFSEMSRVKYPQPVDFFLVSPSAGDLHSRGMVMGWGEPTLYDQMTIKSAKIPEPNKYNAPIITGNY